MLKNTSIVREEVKTEKKAYVRPQLIKHGNVESLTQTPPRGPSCPLDI